jgi:hypothetical protein
MIRRTGLPEHEKPNFIERLILTVIRQSLGGVAKTAEKFIKRMVRLAVMALAGAVIAVLGVAFIAIGAVKWFSILMPSWLAWAIVGVVLLLLGGLLAALVGART